MRSRGTPLAVLTYEVFSAFRCETARPLPAFTLFVGLVDGFNPCAMWVLLFLLPVLVNLKDRRKILALGALMIFKPEWLV